MNPSISRFRATPLSLSLSLSLSLNPMASNDVHSHRDEENGGATCIATTDTQNSSNHRSDCKKYEIIDIDIRSEFSHHDRDVARINNGSFGSCPSSVIESQQCYQLRFLQQPDDFYFNHLKPSILRSRQAIKTLIKADHVDEISIIDNATTAAAIVLQHVKWSFFESKFNPGDTAVMLHYAYGAVKKSVEAYVTRAGGHVIEVKMPFPIASNDEIITAFRNALELGKSDNRKVRLAVIDHITSMPTVVIPVKELVKMCREEGVDHIFVDAAHAIGSIEVDVKEIGADFYTSNLHKWLFCPPSIAFLHCRNPEVANLHHPVVSHEYGNGLAIESSWIGTRDYSAQLVVPEALEFVNRFEGGLDGIIKWNHQKVVEMAEMLVKAWGTNLGSPPEMCSSMAMVGLPPSLEITSDSDALKLRSHLRDCFRVEVPIYYRQPKDGEVNPVTGYARISHQIYNTFDDYYRFRDAVSNLVNCRFTCKLFQD
ncbi:probable L-cysteine desulfhydrase, chloroplastic [Cynara cardunculus var. scolymus]|uniref:probable L-cysteine desulfhydrase, chloroplastic n=1 Tax=Cynara cardunculus var. scolymus TaxID=59895 RepID=UPI000D624A80|nr:probable L-cysteine desulfhydrase, chloroplastic [Cynara cardunculus var. scolymus]